MNLTHTSRAVAGAAVFILLLLTLVGCGGSGDHGHALPVRETHTWSVPAEETRLPAPRSVARCGSNEVVVLDNAARVMIYGTNGLVVRQWRMPESSAGKPEGVIVLRDGHVVVCDTHYHRVVEFDAAGQMVRQFGREGKAPGEFIYPVAVTADDQENLFVAEYGSNDRVQVFTREGKFLRAFGAFGTQPGEFQRPSGVAWRAGLVYVADAFNNRIQLFSDQGKFLRVLETPAMHFPYDLKIEPRGTLLVIEYGAGCLTRLDFEGHLLGRYGTTGSGIGQFATPWGLAVTGDGHVIVADTGNRRLVEVVMK